MKKKLCLLLLMLQGGYLMAQTETFVTINGKKVTINPNAATSANNGLTFNAGNIQLGGDLTRPSVLTTTSAFTLAIKGLQTGTAGDNVMVTDANGVLKTISQSAIASGNEPWFDVVTKAGATLNTQSIYQLSTNMGIGTATPHAQLQLGNTVADRKIVLYEDANNDHQFYGLGIASGLLKFQAPAFSFSSAINATSSKELMRLNNTGLGIGTTTPSNALHVKAATNPVRLEGLQAGAQADKVLTVNEDGVVRTMPLSGTGKIMGIKVTNTNYEVAADDYTVIAANLSADITITLPNATASTGRILVINQMGTATSAGVPLAVKFNTPVTYSDSVRKDQVLSDYYSAATGGSRKVTLQSNGTEWYVISLM